MNKRLSLLCCLTVLCTLLFSVGAFALAEEGECAHSAWCNNPTVCKDCGAEGLEISDENLTHIGEPMWCADRSTHWEECDACNKAISEPENHQGNCNSREYCPVCNTAGVILSAENLTHVGEVGYDYDVLSHWEACSTCGEKLGEEAAHQGTCDAPTTCTVCGGEEIVVFSENRTHVGGVRYDHDFDSHWDACGGCGDWISAEVAHQGTCDAPTTCTVCDAEGITIYTDNLTHTGGVVYDHDNYYHWETCGGCGDSLSVEVEHQGTCDAPTTCTVCGAEGITIYTENLTHTGGVVYDHDGTYHWEACGGCGEKLGEEAAHQGICSADETCTVCGAEGITVYNLTHVGGVSYGHDDTYHWEDCGSCGVSFGGYAAHQGTCDAPTTCTVCGAEGVSISEANISHIGETYYNSDASVHWEFCETCDDEIGEPGNHQATCDAPGTCTECGMTNLEISAENLTHVGEVVYGISESVHWDSCGTCGEKIGDYVRHQGVCTAQETCTVCGGEGIDVYSENLTHVGGVRYDHNSMFHWEACGGCGDWLSVETEHQANCDAEETCIICGAEGIHVPSENLTHVGEVGYEHDGITHWEACGGCGEIYGDAEEHQGTCDAEETCIICGAEGIDIPSEYLTHVGEVGYAHDELFHYEACDVCGESYGNYAHHQGTCDAEETCTICGAEGIHVPYENLTHVGESLTGSDFFSHWQYCSVCNDFIGDAADHNINCDDPSACTVCGTPLNGEQVDYVKNAGTFVHTGEVVFRHDAENHWQECSACFETISGPERHTVHCSAPDTCAECGASGLVWDVSDMSHEGEIVRLMTDDTHHWYSCSGCGGTYGNAPHTAACTTPTVCTFCEATGVTVSEENLTHGNHGIDHNETHHWVSCEDCGEALADPLLHEAFCTDPGVCITCKATGVTIAEDHLIHGSSELVYDATSHWYACEDCEKRHSISEPHQGYCADAGTCIGCGATGVTIAEENLSHGSIAYAHDDASHWEACEDCGEPYSDPLPHEGYCDAAGVCHICEATGVTITEENLYHGGAVYAHDANSHWWACGGCGEPYSDLEPHRGYCADTSTCIGCGATGVTIADDSLIHGEEVYGHDENTHWSMCGDCGDLYSYPLPHEGYCDAAGVCFICEATGVTFFEGYLYHGATVYAHDANSHWKACEACGEQYSDPEPHSGNCDAPDTCDDCNATGVTITEENLYHGATIYDYDANSHWWTCEGCGELYGDPAVHYMDCSNPGVCLDCGAENVNCSEEDTIHNGSVYYECASENEHTKHCSICNAELSRDFHTQACANPGVCMQCGAEGVCFDETVHTAKVPYSYDDEHGVICQACGDTVWSSVHYAFCNSDDQTWCAGCGEYVETIEVRHNGATSDCDSEHHWVDCPYCGVIDMEAHYGSCYDPTTCSGCGEMDVIITEENIEHAEQTYEHDTLSHWTHCEECGVTGEPVEHTIYCTAPDTCAVCEATGIAADDLPIHHSADTEYRHTGDADVHAICCADCGEVKSFEPHIAQCGDDPICADCGAENVNFEYTVHGDIHMIRDAKKHIEVCLSCGERLVDEEHYYNCSSDVTTVCSYCEYESTDGKSFKPYHDEQEDRTDELYHWIACVHCGEVAGPKRPHVAFCFDPNTCYECYATGLSIPEEYIMHTPMEEYFYDVDGHWHACGECGATLDEGEHEIVDGSDSCFCGMVLVSLEIIQQPVSVQAAMGETATVSVAADGFGLTYTWYFKNAGSSTFYRSSISTSSSYSVEMDAQRHGRQVYCVITDQFGNSIRSETATMTAKASLVITQQPYSTSVREGEMATAIVTAEGDGLTYTWYFKNANSGTFFQSSISTSNTYSVEMDASRHGRQVYCVITDRYGNRVQSNTVTLTAKQTLEITSQPYSVQVQEGEYATISVSVSGTGLTYTWYFQNAGTSTFYRSSISTSNTYSVEMNDLRDGRTVYCVIRDAYGHTVQSQTATMTMR